MTRSPYAALWIALLAGTALGACSGGADSPPPSTGGAGGTSGVEDGGGGSAADAAGGSSGTSGTSGVGGSSGSSGSGDAADAGPVACPPDADGDNIPDDIEGRAEGRDSDGDGTPDYLDTDSDGDTVPDLLEADTANVGCNVPLDSDGDGIPNHLDTDSDGNGIDDRDEVYPDGAPYDPSRPPADTDGDGTPDLFDPDNDGDTLDDVDELVGGKGVDTDGDGFDDHNDFDSDGDTIGDEFEGTGDMDGDGKPNFRDLDSDADTVPDRCEAGVNHDPKKPPADSDSDGRYDFLDIDSDNEGVRDGLEDKNGNCQVDLEETDRTRADTDTDGANDLIEQVLDTDPTCGTPGMNPLKACTPGEAGRYWFEMPYRQTPIPETQDVVLKTNLNKGDIAFVVDTTGTMGGAILDIRARLVNIMNEIKKEVPEAHFGILGHDDYPLAPYGTPTDRPVWLPSGTDAYLTSDSTKTLAAVAALTTGNGADLPEAQIPALYKAIEDTLLAWPTGSQNTFGPGGAFGGLGFRSDALPILISITDQSFHNGRFVGSSTLHDTYSFNGAGAGAPPTVDDLISKMNSRGAKYIGIALDDGGPARSNKDPYRDMATITDATNSVVPASAFGSSQCLTDIGGLPLMQDYPPSPQIPTKCRLIFSAFRNGVGVGNTVVEGVKALLRGIQLEVRVLASNDLAFSQPPGIVAIDDFIDYIEVYAPGQIEDPSAPGELCESLDLGTLRDSWQTPYGLTAGPDSYNETASDVIPGIRVCFRIFPKDNVVYAQTNQVQFARAFLAVKAKNVGQTEELDVGEPRAVFFVIPPTPQ